MRRAWIIVALLATGCGKNAEDLGARCEETVTTLALSETSELGFSGEEVAALATAGSPWAETLRWDDGGSTALTLTVSAPTAARFVHSVAVYSDNGADIAIECYDRVEVDVPIDFVTGDGAFDEAWEVVLRSVQGDVATLFHEVDPFDLTGTYDVEPDIEEPEYDSAELHVSGTFDGVATTGAVSGTVSGEEDCDGDECVAWVSNFDIGDWGEQDVQ